MKKNKHLLLIIIAIGALLRFAFLFWGADIYYGKNIFIFGDSFSYANSFINLWEHGSYAIWLDVPESFMGRGPGYPYFWGLHYIIFGKEYVYQAVAISQILLDILAIKLIYDVLKIISANLKIALIGSLLYACYPFIIVWLTITGTEAFASFLVILIIWVFYVKKESDIKYVLLGLLIAYAALTRPYLGIFLPFLWVSLLLLKKTNIDFFKKASITGFCFILLYMPWPIRNYLNYNELVIFNSPTSGYKTYQKDYNSFRSWVYAWEPYSSLINNYTKQITMDTIPIIVPDFVFSSNAEHEQFDTLIEKCRRCGSSFYYWRDPLKPYEWANCNDEIETGFNHLRQSFIQKNKFHYYVKVPLITFYRAIFKMATAENNSSLNWVLFSGRILSILLGFIGAFYFILYNRKLLFISIYPIFWYGFLSVNHMQFEIRYLIQADILLMVIGVLFAERIYMAVKEKRLKLFKS